MNKRALPVLAAELNRADGAAAQVEQYCENHPGSPTAVRRPKIFQEGETFVVLLGRDMQHSVVGRGNTVETALRAFDLQYLSALPRTAAHGSARARTRGGK